MKTINTFSRIAIICLLITLQSCAIIADAPTLADTEIPRITQPISTIDIPVKAELKNYFKEAETSVPNEYSGNSQPCQGLRYGYFFRRSPFNITGEGNTVNLRFVGNYGIDLTYCALCKTIPFIGYTCVVPKISASCGVGGEAPRRMEISYKTTFSAIKPDYHLSSSTVLGPAPNPLDRCVVTILGIDATDRLIGYITDPLNKLGATVDAKVAEVDLKPRIATLWNSISQETKLGEFGYLSLQPQNIRASNFNFTDQSVLNFTLGLSATPVINPVTNPLPTTALPDLTEFEPTNGFDITLDVNSNYEALSREINSRATNQVVKIGNKKFVITNVKVSGMGNQKIVLAIEFKGCRRGTIYFTGTPSYNSISKEITFPDLTFDLKTKSILLKMAKWLFNDKIVTALKDKAKYNFTPVLETNRLKLQTALNRDLTETIKSEATVNQLDIIDLYPSKGNLLLRISSKGQLQILITE